LSGFKTTFITFLGLTCLSRARHHDTCRDTKRCSRHRQFHTALAAPPARKELAVLVLCFKPHPSTHPHHKPRNIYTGETNSSHLFCLHSLPPLPPCLLTIFTVPPPPPLFALPGMYCVGSAGLVMTFFPVPLHLCARNNFHCTCLFPPPLIIRGCLEFIVSVLLGCSTAHDFFPHCPCAPRVLTIIFTVPTPGMLCLF
jgi:hypothetical protein